jgi:hypothetical protein
VAASNAAGRRDAIVLAGKAGAWRPVADGERFGPGHSFSMNLATGARYVSVPVNESIGRCEGAMMEQSLGPEALVAEFVEDHKQMGRAAACDHGVADSLKARL